MGLRISSAGKAAARPRPGSQRLWCCSSQARRGSTRARRRRLRHSGTWSTPLPARGSGSCATRTGCGSSASCPLCAVMRCSTPGRSTWWWDVARGGCRARGQGSHGVWDQREAVCLVSLSDHWVDDFAVQHQIRFCWPPVQEGDGGLPPPVLFFHGFDPMGWNPFWYRKLTQMSTHSNPIISTPDPTWSTADPHLSPSKENPKPNPLAGQRCPGLLSLLAYDVAHVVSPRP
jgi:hypothetical protein